MPRYVEGAAGGPEKGFGSKPARGWLHADKLILNDGVTFNVRYIGCLEVRTSMKQLNFQTRSEVAKECINRVCEAASVKTSTKKRRIDKHIQQSIGDMPNMNYAGTNVILTVSSRFLSLVNMENGDVIAKHDMPTISFASGGDTETLDFVSYVAKTQDDWRACYVLECGGGQAQNLISTIGQAFELRYKEYSKESENHMHGFSGGGTDPIGSSDFDQCHGFFRDSENLNTNTKEYYNDLPGKLPPDMLSESDFSTIAAQISNKAKAILQPRERLSSNLIDLNSPPPDHNYVNDEFTPASASAVTHDVFDMQPFSLTIEVQRSQLMTELWYHSAISRPTAEGLLKNDGDFLVRETQGKPGQYVLTGLQVTTPKHLLLIGPEGLVRTRDRIFDSISHLINYHWTNHLPILSEESALVLRNPVPRNLSQSSAK